MNAAASLFQADRLTLGLALPWVDAAEHAGRREVDFPTNWNSRRRPRPRASPRCGCATCR